MKNKSDNFRDSSILAIIESLVDNGREVTIHEPNISEPKFLGCKVENDFIKFSQSTDLIIANRWDKKLDIVRNKVFTRDVFQRD